MEIIAKIEAFYKKAILSTKLDNTSLNKYKTNLDQVLDGFFNFLPYKHKARDIFSYIQKVKNNPDAENYEKDNLNKYMDYLNKNKVRLESYQEMGDKIFNLSPESAKKAKDYKSNLVDIALGNIDALVNSKNWNEFESKYKEQVDNYIEMDDDLGF